MKLIHLLALLPFIGMLGFLPWVNRVEPYVLGMPFILFWMVAWVVIASAMMGIVYRLDPRNKGGDQ